MNVIKLAREALGLDPIRPEDVNLDHMPLMVRILEKLYKRMCFNEVNRLR